MSATDQHSSVGDYTLLHPILIVHDKEPLMTQCIDRAHFITQVFNLSNRTDVESTTGVLQSDHDSCTDTQIQTQTDTHKHTLYSTRKPRIPLQRFQSAIFTK